MDGTELYIIVYGYGSLVSHVDTIWKVVIILIVGKIGKSVRRLAIVTPPRSRGFSYGWHPGRVATIFGITETFGMAEAKSRMISVRRLLSGRSSVDRTRVTGTEPVKGWTNP
jgi:hypothetical protein